MRSADILVKAPSNADLIYAGDDNGTLFATSSGDTYWVTGRNPSGAGIVTSLAVDPTSATVVYATYSGFDSTAGKHVFKIIDGGRPGAKSARACSP